MISLESWTSLRSKLLLLFLLVIGGIQLAYAAPSSGFVYPLMDTRVSSSYGNRRHPIQKAVRHHQGVDLAAPRGATIRAVRRGVVVFADPYAAYGNLVVIKHDNGYTSHYGHCDRIRVKPGQKIKAGEIIATVGSTGRVTGPHLHFEIRLNGQALDPERLFPGLREEAVG